MRRNAHEVLFLIAMSCLLPGCQKIDETELREACLQAKIAAIDTCIAKCERYRKGVVTRSEKGEIRRADQILTKLRAERTRCALLDAASFTLPEAVTVKGYWNGHAIKEGPSQSRKGPYYVIAQSRRPVKENRKYAFVLYPLHRYVDPLAGVDYVYAYVVDH